MDIKKAFRILNIDMTKDEGAIVNAYRAELQYNNPEDNQEGFKQLREAFETAINYAREDEEKELSDFDLWINECEEVYKDIDSRRDLNAWKELFEQEICSGIDNADESRERFLVFIMSHHLLPREVWELIDETFSVRDDVEILSEKFPADFLHYIIHYMENDGYLTFDNIEYRSLDGENAEVDEYINELMTLHRDIAVNPSIDQLVSIYDIAKYDVYHPYEDIFRMMIYVDALDKMIYYSDKEEIIETLPFERESFEEEIAKITGRVSELCEKLLELDNLTVFEKSVIATGLWYTDNKDAARDMWKEILQDSPQNINSRIGVARDLLFKEEYEAAADEMDEILQGRDDKPEIIRLMNRINDNIISLYKKQLEDGVENPKHPGSKLAIDLAWKLWHNEDVEGAKELIEKTTPDSDSVYEYENIYGRLLYSLNKYKEALPHLLKWCELLEDLEGLEEKDLKRRLERRPMAHTCAAVCYFEFKDREKSEEHMVKAVQYEKEREGHSIESLYEYRIQYAKMLNQWKDYPKCIDVCDEMIKDDSNCYSAYLIHQEACYEIGRAQMVIDDYGISTNIVPNYYRPYLYAAMVFYDYDQYDNGLEIINRAKEAGVEFNRKMKLYEERFIWSKLKSGDDAKEAHDILDELIANYEPEEVDGVSLAEIYSDKSFAYMIELDFDNAIKFIDKAIKEEPQNPKFYLIKGDWLSEDGNKNKDLKEAAKSYENAKKLGMVRSAWLYFSLGYCYENLKQYEKAGGAYEDAIDVNPQYKTVYQRYINMELKLYSEGYNNIYSKKAEEYGEKLLDEIPDDAGSYWYYAKACNEGQSFDKSMKLFLLGADKFPDDCNMLYKAGSCFRRSMNYDKALEYLTKCVELQKKNGRREIGAIRELGYLYEMLFDYDKALECYERELDLSEYKDACYEHIGDIYLYKKQYEKAIEEYKKIKEYPNDNLIARVYHFMGDTKKGEITFKEASVKTADDDRHFLHRGFGDYYMENSMDYKKSIREFEKAIEWSDTFESKYAYAVNNIKNAILLKDKKKAKEYANEAMGYFEKMNITMDCYLADAGYSPIFYGRLAWVKAGLGEYEEALSLLRKMGAKVLCKSCKHNGCFEASLFSAIIYEFMGEEKKAIEYYKETLKRNPNDEFAMGLLEKYE